MTTPQANTYGPLIVERLDGIATVRLNRPDVLNALDTDTLLAIADVFNGFSTEFDLRVAVLAGEGRAFSAGADRKNSPGGTAMRESSGAGERERRWWAQLGHRATTSIANCEIPVIAAVQGWCVGGGLALALAADFRIAASDARFSIPEIDLGIPLAWGATPRLIDEIGASKAREMILMCDPIDAPEAARLGVVHKVVANEALHAEVERWARRLLAKPQMAVHQERTKFRGYAASSRLGDVTETDGELMAVASRSATARAAFQGLA